MRRDCASVEDEGVDVWEVAASFWVQKSGAWDGNGLVDQGRGQLSIA